ncbi:hypothetical protein BDY24DRAFT_437879 [Mrakia frigida]|uniref:uncharacterized protein n=1 Tax=Mrakia frigida TaxID=29902 RepID=UPI003FCBF91D
MDQILFQIEQLQEQARLQAASIAQLSSTVALQTTKLEAHTSAIALLTSQNQAQLATNARISSVIQDQDRVIGELSKAAIPAGHWIRDSSRREEGKEEERRWLWSLEKYKVLPPPNVASGPPTSLLSLPVELLSLILDLLETEDHLVLSLVSFKLLELSSRCVYGEDVSLNPVQAYDFVESRVFQSSPKSERITSLLLPSNQVRLYGSPTDDSFQDLVELASALPSPPTPLPAHLLNLDIRDINELSPWMDLICFLDPAEFHLWIGGADGHTLPPTVSFVPLDFVTSFTSYWTRFTTISFAGPGSILLVEGTESTSAFEACLRRCSPTSRFLQVEMWTKTGVETSWSIDKEDIPTCSVDFEDLEDVQIVMLDLAMGETKQRPGTRRRDNSSSSRRS